MAIIDDVQLPVAAEGEADRARLGVFHVRHDHGHEPWSTGCECQC